MLSSINEINKNDSIQRLELYISGRNLLDLDFFSKSDPYVKIYYKKNPLSKQIYLGRTETIDNNLNPNFKKTFLIDYIFQSQQKIRFLIYDDDGGNQSNDDFIGEVNTTVGTIAGAKNQTSLLDLINHQNKNKNQKIGKLIIRIQPCLENNQFLLMKWYGTKLMNTDSYFDFIDKSDPYLKFLKIRTDNSFIESGRTEIIKNNLNPKWKSIQIALTKLISPQNDTGKFKIQCWDWQKQGQNKHQFIGQIYLELKQIQKNINNNNNNNNKLPLQYILKNPKQKKPGKIYLEQFKIITKPTFLDFLKSGLELSLAIAIDFTGSNGTPNNSSSLHYINSYQPNQYQLAITAVSKILLNYDSDKRIPCFGFGAQPHFSTLNSNGVQHCFPLSGNPSNTQAYGLEHLMQLYNTCLENVSFSGPTYFSPLIKEAIRIASATAQQGLNTYHILLILTDGQIHDMQQTIQLLVNHCNIPLSLIIVGLGNANFANMVRLDGDNGLYDSKGHKATRDIVQFVPFREVSMNQDLLAQQLLAQLPAQVTQYMNLIGKLPAKNQFIDIDTLFIDEPINKNNNKNNNNNNHNNHNNHNQQNNQNPYGNQ